MSTGSTGSTPSPAARRPATATWRDPRLVIGIVIVAVCVVAGARLFGSADDTVPVWAARADLPSGSSVGPEDLVRREVRFASAADANRYVSGGTALPQGSTLGRAVGAGELLPRSALGAAETGPVVEVPLSVEADAVPASVQTGSVVDVWVTPDAAAGPGSSGPDATAVRVLEAVRVLGAPVATDTLAPAGTRQVIVGVDEAQEDLLPEALARAATGTTVITRRG